MPRRTRSSTEIEAMAPYLNKTKNSAFLRNVLTCKGLDGLSRYVKTRYEFTLKRISSIEKMLNFLKTELGALLACTLDNSSLQDLFDQLQQFVSRRGIQKREIEPINKIIYAFEAMTSAYQVAFNVLNIPVTQSGLEALSYKLEIAKLELSVIEKNDLENSQQETFQTHTNALKGIVHARYPNKKVLDDEVHKQFRTKQTLLKDTQSKILDILTKNLNASDALKRLRSGRNLKLKEFIRTRKTTLLDYERLVKIVPIYKQLMQRFENILLKMHEYLDTEIDSSAKQNSLQKIEFLIDTLCKKLECFTQFLSTYTTDLMHNEIFLIALFLAQNSRLTPKLCLNLFKAGLRIPLLYVLDKNQEIIESITKLSSSGSNYFENPPTNFLNALHACAQNNGFPEQAKTLTGLINQVMQDQLIHAPLRLSC